MQLIFFTAQFIPLIRFSGFHPVRDHYEPTIGDMCHRINVLLSSYVNYNTIFPDEKSIFLYRIKIFPGRNQGPVFAAQRPLPFVRRGPLRMGFYLSI